MMMILEDTRQQESKHKNKHDYFRLTGIHWTRTALYCGDYTLPANQSVCVDTKKDIAELIGDIQVRQMSKSNVKSEVWAICEQNHILFDLADGIYHAICDDDTNRFAEKEINDICFQNGITERPVSSFQALYVKRHGFFHRGLKRAQNSQIKLFVLVENKDGITNVRDLFSWHNPRLDIFCNSKEIIGYYRNGRPRYRRIQMYPRAMAGEQLAKSCLTMEQKYGVTFLFCHPEEAGRTVLKLLNAEVIG